MIICICKTISEKDVWNAIIDGCETFEEMIDKKRFNITGKDCRICYDDVRKIFDRVKNEKL